jgi:hypothetical protein
MVDTRDHKAISYALEDWSALSANFARPRFCRPLADTMINGLGPMECSLDRLRDYYPRLDWTGPTKVSYYWCWDTNLSMGLSRLLKSTQLLRDRVTSVD